MSERRFKPSDFAFPLILGVLVAAALVWRKELVQIFGSTESIRAFIERAGVWAPVSFVALQLLQVVVFVVPGEVVQIAGGYLFGVAGGTALSLLGIAAGSLVDFALARALGRRFVSSLVGREKLERLDGIAASPKAATAFFLLFLIPGIPKDALCFVAGLSPMGLARFVGISMAARFPGILGSAVMGAALESGQKRLFIIVAASASALFVLGFLFRHRIHERIEAVALRVKVLRDRREHRGP